MSVKDPIQAFVDEITLLRNELADLKRSSLNKDEAKAFNADVAKILTQLSKTAPALQDAIRRDLAQATNEVRVHAVEAAEKAARDAIQKSQAEALAVARTYSMAAGEARKQAWRYFGGFWVWLASVGATGALLGALAMFWLQGRADANAFGQYPSIYCTSAGGQIVANPEGRRFCALWVDPPTQAGS